MAIQDDGSVGLSQNAGPAILQYQNRPVKMPQFSSGLSAAPGAAAPGAVAAGGDDTPGLPTGSGGLGSERQAGGAPPGVSSPRMDGGPSRLQRRIQLGKLTPQQAQTRLSRMVAHQGEADPNRLVPGPNTMGLAPQTATGSAAPSGTLGTGAGTYAAPMAGQTQGYPAQPFGTGFSAAQPGQTQGYPVKTPTFPYDWK